jgi:hypothetical protein
MKAYGGMDVEIHVFLTSTLVCGERSYSRPGRFTPEKEFSVPFGKKFRWALEPAFETRMK